MRKKKWTIHAPQLSITDSKVKWPLCFSYVQYVHPVPKRCERRILREAPLQSIQSPQKIWTIPVYKCREAIVLLQINTLGCQQNEMGHKFKIHALYVLQYSKKHLTG